MATLWLNDLRKVVEAAEHCGGEVGIAVKNLHEVIDALEEKGQIITDHRDLWEQGTGDVHPLRMVMTECARKYKEADYTLREEQQTAKHPQARYEQKVFKPGDSWTRNEIPVKYRASGMIILETLMNRDELDADIHYWGSGASHDETHHSVTYYVIPTCENKGLVMNKGGGWCLLKEDLEVNIDTWLKVLNNEMPLPKAWLHK
jgi:hypothetical protein